MRGSALRGRAATLAALALAGSLSTAPGCAFAVDHPAVTAGTVAGTLGFGTCKLASDDYAACGLVGAGAAAFLALVAATAVWLGGDGHTVLTEEQAQPIPDDAQPKRRPPHVPPDPAIGPEGVPAPAGASPPPSPRPTSEPTAPAGPIPASPSAAPDAPAPAKPDPEHIKSP